MDEISSDELYEKLILYGLFSEKLPDVFDCTDFLNFCSQKNRKGFQGGKYNYVSYESMRNNNVPRIIGIPTPMSYQLLCRCISDNWTDIRDHFRKYTSNQKHIVSRIHIRKMNEMNALFKMNYSNWKIDGTPEPDIIIGKSYRVSVDISKCFPSIYTHALPWALIGKENAKKNKNSKSWYNDIDKYTRNTTNEETHGILIGPHTSNILSEIILCKVDYELCKKWDYIRHIDDYTCYVKDKNEADSFIIDVGRELKKYGLFLNHKKTKIEEMPVTLGESWVNQIQSKIIYFEKFHPYVKYSETKIFINFCIDLMYKNNKNSSILFYGLKVLTKLRLTNNAKRYVEKIFASLAIIYPYFIPMLHTHIFIPFNTEQDFISKITNLIFNNCFKKNIFEGCSYSLYYAILSSFELDNFNIDDIIDKNDCMLLLMSLIYCRNFNRKDYLKKLKNHAKTLSNDYMDEYWIFIYECLSSNELRGDWKKLKEAKVSFLQTKYRK